MSDNSNTGMPEDDKKTSALLALLYPEEGADVGESDPGLEDELSSMQTLRSLFRDMPEEEPSDALTNKLMAMAAQHAPAAKSESKGIFAWFSDLLMPIVGHPGLAAAATLVLVVGVAGTLYVKGGAQMAEPQVASRAEAPGEASAPEPSVAPASAYPETATLDEEERNLNSEELQDSEGEGGEDRFKDQDPARERSELGRLSDSLDAKSASDKSSGKRGAANLEKGNLSGAIGGLDQGVATGSGGFGRGGGGADGAGRRVTGITDAPASAPAPDPKPEPIQETTSSTQPRASKSAPAPSKPTAQPKKSADTRSPGDSAGAEFAPPPPPEAASEEDADDEASKEAPSKKKKEQKSSGPSASDLHNQAVRAANSGDCKRVLELGNQIRKIDSAYYDRTFLSDPKVKACRAAVK